MSASPGVPSSRAKYVASARQLCLAIVAASVLAGQLGWSGFSRGEVRQQLADLDWVLEVPRVIDSPGDSSVQPTDTRSRKLEWPVRASSTPCQVHIHWGTSRILFSRFPNLAEAEAAGQSDVDSTPTQRRQAALQYLVTSPNCERIAPLVVLRRQASAKNLDDWTIVPSQEMWRNMGLSGERVRSKSASPTANARPLDAFSLSEHGPEGEAERELVSEILGPAGSVPVGIRLQDVQSSALNLLSRINGKTYGPKDYDLALNDFFLSKPDETQYWGLSFRAAIASIAIQLGLLGLGVTLLHRTKRLGQAVDGDEEPWLLIDASGPFERAGAGAWRLGIAASSLPPLFAVWVYWGPWVVALAAIAALVSTGLCLASLLSLSRRPPDHRS